VMSHLRHAPTFLKVVGCGGNKVPVAIWLAGTTHIVASKLM
jgi:hypothetical protein